jgi:hypothetical protein
MSSPNGEQEHPLKSPIDEAISRHLGANQQMVDLLTLQASPWPMRI